MGLEWIFIIVLVASAAIALGVGIVIAILAGRGVLFLFKHVFSFVFGEIGDLVSIVGAVLAGVVLGVLTILNVLIGRWSAANHYAVGVQKEAGVMGSRIWSALVYRPLRLVFLDGLLEGVQSRVPNAIQASPGRDQPTRGIQFPGYQVTGSLPSGGSGAKLFIARPIDEHASDRHGAVVIKSFALSQGSSLPQIVRESKGLDAARRLGLVLESHIDDSQFWYVMPYRAGEHLTTEVHLLHGSSSSDGLRGKALESIVEYERELVSTLSSYHSEGLWHKDVKPDNIIVEHGEVHLVDLGLVTHLGSAMTLTTHGTEYFRDPEMVRMALRGVKVHQVDGAKFDIYAAGAVLYFMLENTFPAHGALSRFEKDSPEVLRWIVRRSMTDYESRYDSAEMMLADLDTVAASDDPWSLRPADLPSLSGRNVQLSSFRPRVRASRPLASTPPPLPAKSASGNLRRSNPHQPVRMPLAILTLGVIAAIILTTAYFAFAVFSVQPTTVNAPVISKALPPAELSTTSRPAPVGLGRFVVINDHPAIPHPNVQERVTLEVEHLEGIGWRKISDDPAAEAALAVAMRQDGARKGGPFDPVIITLKRLGIDGVLWITAPDGEGEVGNRINANLLFAPEDGEMTDSSTSSIGTIETRNQFNGILLSSSAGSCRECLHGLAA